MASDERWMRRALELAQSAAQKGEVPVGALVIDPAGLPLGEGANACEANGDPTAHAEMQALGEAVKKAGSARLPGATLYCTVEPCPMCAGAMVLARIARVVFGCRQPKFGGMASRYGIGLDGQMNHQMALTEGVLSGESAALLSAFFRERR
jgi:tRNA(adenine34) deaminase